MTARARREAQVTAQGRLSPAIRLLLDHGGGPSAAGFWIATVFPASDGIVCPPWTIFTDQAAPGLKWHRILSADRMERSAQPSVRRPPPGLPLIHVSDEVAAIEGVRPEAVAPRPG
jgi:hypothetical protein